MDDYIASFPEPTAQVLRKIREIVLANMPEEFEEKISYGVAGYKVGGKNCVFFAGFKAHVSVYPLINPSPELAEAVKPYQSGKATVKFPLSKPIPYDLIERIVRFLVEERLAGRY